MMSGHANKGQIGFLIFTIVFFNLIQFHFGHKKRFILSGFLFGGIFYILCGDWIASLRLIHILFSDRKLDFQCLSS